MYLVVSGLAADHRTIPCQSSVQILMAACGVLDPCPGNPSPLHWKADSQPLDQQGSLARRLV